MSSLEASPDPLGAAHVELVHRIRSGDEAAEDELVATFRRRVYVVLLGRVRDPEAARELAQDVLMTVLRAVRDGKLEEPAKLPGFMHGVARNLANNHLRRRADAPVWVELDETAAWADAAEEAEMADRRRLVQQAVAKLDRADRRILALSVVEGRSAPEVSAILGMSPDAIRARKSRALKALKARMGDLLSHFGGSPPLDPRGADS